MLRVIVVSHCVLLSGCILFSTTIPCRSDADCADGACEEARCVPVADDGGQTIDAGEPSKEDGGTIDAGTADAGDRRDAGEDAGPDAGVDAGADAGAQPCGDGVRDLSLGETCDDGNQDSGDGCAFPSCTVEENFSCGCGDNLVVELGQAGSAPTTYGTGGGAGVAVLACPAGQIATGVFGEMNDMGDGFDIRVGESIGLVCSEIVAAAGGEIAVGDEIEALSNPTNDDVDDVESSFAATRCDPGDVLVGLRGLRLIDPFGLSDYSLVCEPLIHGIAFGDNNARYERDVAGSDGDGDTPDQSVCAFGESVVGFSEVGYGRVLDRVRVSCAPPTLSCGEATSICAQD